MHSFRPMVVAFLATFFAFFLTQSAAYGLPPVGARMDLMAVGPGGVQTMLWWWNADPKDEWEKVLELEDRAAQYAQSAFANATAEFEDSAAKIGQLVEHFKGLVADIGEFSDGLMDRHGVSLSAFSREFDDGLDRAVQGLKDEFPPSDTAPGHEERQDKVDSAFRLMENAFITAGVKVGLPRDELQHWWSRIVAGLKPVLVTAGDLIELHPTIAETVLVTAIILVLPEVAFARPLVRIFGFSPEGVEAGSLAAWAQRFFYGAEVKAGSLFSKLQHWGTGKGGGVWKHFWDWVKGLWSS